MLRAFDRMLFAVIGALTLALVAVLAGLADAGPLDPNGPPAPTMKTLDEIPGSWSRTLPANDGAPGPDPHAGCNSSRFQCVFGNDAVLDRETGLVWELTPFSGNYNWVTAHAHCQVRVFGTRRGGRLPTAQELLTLNDVAVSNPSLPPGHPFSAFTGTFWTASTSLNDRAKAYTVDFFDIYLTAEHLKSEDQTHRAWCVRAPGGDGDGVAAHDVVPTPSPTLIP